MMPGNVPSTLAVGGVYAPPDDLVTSPAEDFEMGGIALSDPTQGHLVQTWRLFLDPADRRRVMIEAPNHPASLVFTRDGILEVSFTFDQNMRPAVAYKTEFLMALRWYDTQVNQYITSEFEVGRNPKMTLDDKRRSQQANSDMLFAYIRGTGLYYRQQRDRFTIERLLRANITPNLSLKNIGMNLNWRVQAELVVTGV